jgi:gas vesicle protein
MNTDTENGGNGRFLIGLIAGGVIGAGLAVALAPRLASELGQRAKASATDLTHAASRRYQQVSTRIATAADEVTAKAQAVRNDVADAVGRTAREVEQIAMASKTVPRPKRS